MDTRRGVIKHIILTAACLLLCAAAAFAWYGRNVLTASRIKYNDSLYINGNESFTIKTYCSKNYSDINVEDSELENLAADKNFSGTVSGFEPGDTIFFRTVLKSTQASQETFKNTYVSMYANNITYTAGLGEYLTFGVSPMKPLKDFEVSAENGEATVTKFPLVENFEITEKEVSIYWSLHFSETYSTPGDKSFGIEQIELLYN